MYEREAPAVVAEGLVKHYTGREGAVEAVRGVDLAVSTGEIFGFLGPNGAGKSTTVRMLTTLLSITAGRAEVAGIDVAGDPDAARGADRRRAPGGGPRPAPDGARAPHPARAALRAERDGGQGARGGAAGAGRARGCGRPRDQGLLGRYAAPPRPRGGARARTGCPLPRRAHHRSRPGEPPHNLGRAPPHQRARDDDLPHHPVPGGGRPALRQDRDHRRRPHRSRGHAEEPQGRPARTARHGSGAEPRRRLPRRHRADPRPRGRRGPGGERVNPTIALGRRSLREAIRQPDALFMTMFIPIFFLVVNTGQAAEIFPSDSTGFLEGQGYGAFQLPITLLLAASFGMAALFLVEEIEGGYFDKLRAIPIPHYSIVLGRLVAEGAKCIVISILIVVIALPFGISIASGPLGFVLLILLSALWGVVYAGFMQLIALKTRSAAATNSGGLIFFPLLFLTPNFVPRELLTEPMEVAASVNPVTYLMEAMRSLILNDIDWGDVLPGFGVIAVFGVIMLVLNVRMIKSYD